MKVIYMVLSEGSEMEIVGTQENYEVLRDEYLKYIEEGEQSVYVFKFPNNGELLINFDEIVSLYSEDENEEDID